ncbi:PLDc N-terminal domain-containing protein [Homoserinimonas sp. OAct 916]|uniref:PLDc N-terminal domain-containing protein n=1 Tax=Homoserinimonas sp. OAct 916 TaxID=2211450 RepID=UPI000DBE5C12|nr:PLDc N-terminal domain-containing protein [Homoserinimonas sp. OAct 916]
MAVLLSVITFVALLGALIDIVTKQDSQVKHLPKMAWIILVILLPLIGTILWFAIGREYEEQSGRGGFGESLRRQRPAVTTGQPVTSTEQELADLEREIEEEHLRRLEAEWDKRRRQSGCDAQ